MTSLQYPIGLYEPVENKTKEQLEAWIDMLAEIPQQYEAVTNQLTDAQLDTPYRPGGWTVRQLIHHVADSHLNAYLRFKLALTEETPHIRRDSLSFQIAKRLSAYHCPSSAVCIVGG